MEELEYKKMFEIENNHWWFIAKRKLIKILFKRFLQNIESKDLKSLDVGCGTGAVLKFLQDASYKAKGIDFSDTALRYCKSRGLDVQYGIATKIPMPDNSFDIITALDVVEHIEDDKNVIKELYRVLKPGGICIITVPAHMWLWSYHDVSLHHKRRYSKNSLKQLANLVSQDFFISWFHMFILIPVTFVRFFGKLLKNNKSDVGKSSWLVNFVMSIVYFFELGLFSLFGRIPFGTSLVLVIKK
ncbi:MAG: methyltransferase type 11 [uncultured bacterium]|nr:MAG: methyltransferase type 11 [uncultured bacterium]